LIAAKVSGNSSLFDTEVRPCILDETIPVPDKYQLHYWIYPNHKTIVMRDAMSLNNWPMKSTKHMIYFQTLKFFPLGFWVVDRSDITSPPRFGDFNAVEPAVLREVTIDLQATRRADFPEGPTSDGVTLFTQESGAAAVARRRPKRGS
jgi:hypothetical protein